jgi:flavodoxin
MTDGAEDTTQLQNAVRSFLSAMEPEESVEFASLVYFYNGCHDIRYNGRILCARVATALVCNES